MRALALNVARMIARALASTPPPIHQQASIQYWTSFEEDRDAA